MRWLRENDPEWSERSTSEKKSMIIANKEHGGRGAARTMQTVHKACACVVVGYVDRLS